MCAGAWPSQLAVQYYSSSGKPLLYVEPAVNRQLGFRQDFVGQITSFIMSSQIFILVDILKYLFTASSASLDKFLEN